MVQKPHWFQHSTNPKDLEVRKESVTIENRYAIDYSLNGDGNHESSHMHHTGENFSGKQFINVENGVDAAEKQYIDLLKKERGPSSSYLKFIEEDIVAETPGLKCLTGEHDCLDVTFDSIESCACKETTSGKFPFDSLSTTVPVSYEQQQQSLDNTFELSDVDYLEKGKFEKKAHIVTRDGLDFELVRNSSNNHLNANISTGFCSIGGSSSSFGFIADKIGSLFQHMGNEQLKELPNQPPSNHLKSNIETTGNESISATENTTSSDQAIRSNNTNILSDQSKTYQTEQEQLGFYVSTIPMNRDNSLVNTQLADNSAEEKRDRMKRLRQSKRTIERERFGQSQSQTIVIPRNSLYSRVGNENVKDSKPHTLTRNLQVGSTVTSKQAEKFFLRRKIAFIVTILLITIGVVILALALFWPARML